MAKGKAEWKGPLLVSALRTDMDDPWVADRKIHCPQPAQGVAPLACPDVSDIVHSLRRAHLHWPAPMCWSPSHFSSFCPSLIFTRTVICCFFKALFHFINFSTKNFPLPYSMLCILLSFCICTFVTLMHLFCRIFVSCIFLLTKILFATHLKSIYYFKFIRQSIASQSHHSFDS